MSHTWDPEQYHRYADERGRPFHDLVSRIPAADPRAVVDLGCGSGHLTASLKERWPDADVHGVDASEEMVAAAPRDAGVTFEVGDLRDWQPERPVDVLVSNAALQWVPGHLYVLPALVQRIAPGGWLAFQVPGNFGAPSHTLRQQIEEDPRFAPHLAAVTGPHAYDPQVYLRKLLDLGCEVDAWETTYLHVLQGEDAVYEWAVGTGARPTLLALPDDLREEFAQELREALRTAYPSGRHGTVMPFRRVFVVARTPAEA